MANPTLPAHFNLGDYLGKAWAPTIKEGINKGYQAHLLEKGLKDMDPNAPLQERWAKFAALPLDKEHREHGMKILEKIAKGQASLGTTQKNLAARSKQVEGLEDQIQSLSYQDRMSLEGEIQRRGGDERAVDSVLSEYLQNPNTIPGARRQNAPQGPLNAPQSRQAPQQGGQPPQPQQTQPGTQHERFNQAFGNFLKPQAPLPYEQRGPVGKYLSAFENGFKGESLAGALVGNELTDKEKQQVFELGLGGEIAQALGGFAGDAIFWAAGGPLGGALMTGIGKAISREVWKEARSDEAITPERIGEITNRVLQEAAKSGIEGAIFKGLPVSRAIKKIPGMEKALTGPVREGLLRLGENALNLGATRPLLEGRLPNQEDIGRGAGLALAFEGAHAARATPGALQGEGRGAEGGPPPNGPPPNGPPPQPPGAGPTGAQGGNPLGAEPRVPQPNPSAPPPLEAMVNSARTGQEALAQRQAIQKSAAHAPFRTEAAITPLHEGFQAEEGSGAEPGTEARGDVSVPLAPQPAFSEPTAKPQPPRNPVQRGALSDANVIAEQTSKAQPKQYEQRAIQAPFAELQMEPVAREARMGKMRGEKPFLPEEQQPSGREKTETLQKREVTQGKLKSQLDALKKSIQELNQLEQRRDRAKPEAKASLDQEIQAKRSEIDALKKDARALNKELQGKEPLGDEQIENAITRRRAKLIEDASAGTERTDKEIAREQVNRKKREDKLATAKKLGKKPTPEHEDSFTRVKQRYVDEFTRVRDAAAKEMAKEDKGSREHEIAKRVHDEAAKLVEEAQADLTIHKHKKGKERSEEQAKVKEQHKERAKTEAKTAKLTPKKLNEFTKQLKAYTERPSDTKASEALADTLGVSKDSLQQIHEGSKEAGRDFASRRFIHIKPTAKNKEGAKGKEQEGTKSKEGAKENNLNEDLKNAHTSTGASKPGPFGRLKANFKELVSSLSKGKFKEVWSNPLGRAFIIQGAAAGIDEALKANDVKFPYSQFVTYAMGGAGRGFRALASGVINAIKVGVSTVSNRNLINDYNETFKTRDLQKRRLLEKRMTPKLKKAAEEKRRK